MKFPLHMITYCMLVMSGTSQADKCRDLADDYRYEHPALDRVFLQEQTKLIGEVPAQKVHQDLLEIVNKVSLPQAGPLTAAAFNGLLEQVTTYATKNGITIEPVIETTGVFPNGLRQIGVSNLAKKEDTGDAPTFSDLHELAHLFHVVQVRATILSGLKENPTSETLDQAAAFVDALEAGRNYRLFEQLAYGVSSPVTSIWASTRSVQHFQERMQILITATHQGLLAGKMKVTPQLTLVDAYAIFISKAPLLVGTSGKDLTLRLSIVVFAILYIRNVQLLDLGFDEDRLRLLGLDGRKGFKDLVNSFF